MKLPHEIDNLKFDTTHVLTLFTNVELHSSVFFSSNLFEIYFGFLFVITLKVCIKVRKAIN